MKLPTLARRYFGWHYTTGLVDCVRLSANFIWFVYHFFSVPEVTRTLFAPWRRLGESYRVGFHPERALEALLVNTLMRFFGFVVRIIWLVIALVVILSTLVLGLLLTAVFFGAPVIISASFIIGCYLVFLV